MRCKDVNQINKDLLPSLSLRKKLKLVIIWQLQARTWIIVSTGPVPAMKSEATAIFAPQDGRWKISVSFDGRRFCVPKFRH